MGVKESYAIVGVGIDVRVGSNTREWEAPFSDLSPVGGGLKPCTVAN